MLYQQIAQNKRKTVLVMAGFFLLVALIGAAIGYLFARSAVGGVIIAGVIALVYMAVIIGQSTDVVMNMNNAREIHSAQEAPALWHVVEDMAMVAQVPMPRVFIIDDPSPNAFATGNNPEHAAVAATTGLMEIMNREELEAVIVFKRLRWHCQRQSACWLTLPATFGGLAEAEAMTTMIIVGVSLRFWGRCC